MNRKISLACPICLDRRAYARKLVNGSFSDVWRPARVSGGAIVMECHVRPGGPTSYLGILPATWAVILKYVPVNVQQINRVQRRALLRCIYDCRMVSATAVNI